MAEVLPTRLTRPQRALLAVVPPLAATLLRLLDLTLRYEVQCEPGAHAATPEEPGIWCFWHRCLLGSACYFHHRPRTTLLISRSFDGELIARTIERMGFVTVRGSSTRGGASGLRALAQAIGQGASAVFPADGPRGPLYQLKPGAIKLAQLAGLGVGSFYIHTERAWQLRSWDGFLIPKPFSRVVIVWGRVVPVDRELDGPVFEATRCEVQAALERVRAQAEQHFTSRH